jgi:5'(3')-deoxyribonucleotidase
MKYHNLKDINNNVPKAGSFKHFLRIQENGGRVVKGVNTTADVGTDGIKKQAAKFGNTVDKDGRPPTLSKKVKGSKTNVLFNLGMSESVDNTHESVLYYSKMAENLGELASTSKVYVDMDGVLADFFGEWQKLIGSDWRKVKDIEPALQKIRDKDNFWLDLPLLPQAKNLLGIIKKVKGSYTILSSPLPNDPNSEPHKREWIKKNLDFFPPENVIITHDKPKYAVNSDGTPNILIDDFGKNIASWEAAGGEGFKHKDHKFERTAKAIKQHMSEPVEERTLTKGEEKTKEKNVKGMKKNKGDFEKRYGKDAKAVMYATATKMAKESLLWSIETGQNINESLDKIIQVLEEMDRRQFMKTAGATAALSAIPSVAKAMTNDTVVAKGSNGKDFDISKFPGDVDKKIKTFKDAIANVYAKNPDANPPNFTIHVNNKPYLQIDHNGNIYKKVPGEDELDAIAKRMSQGQESIDENFADGKVKGKSKPGRVKKSGASCSSSVTELRKKAKNASGERAKMYHWCANMKSGQAKKGK